MQLTIHSSVTSRRAGTVLLLITAFGAPANASGGAVPTSDPPRELAFARFVTHVQRDPFKQSGPVGVLIEASVPELFKSAALLAVRRQGEDKRSELQVLQSGGDGTVVSEVIERYFTLRQEFDMLPVDSVAITPSNYKFHYAGQVKTGGAAAYVYDITPKKNRPGLLQGRIWMDAATGQEVILCGQLIDLPAAGGRIEVVRETRSVNGFTVARVTHVGFSVPLLGRATVVITEAVQMPELIPDFQ